MTEKQLFHAIGSVNDKLVQSADTVQKKPPDVRLVVTRWAAVAAAACLVLVAGLSLRYFTDSQRAVPQIQMYPVARTMEAFGFMRKFFHYNGYRYAFVADGALFDFSEFELTNRLGVLEHDIVAGMSGQSENPYTQLDGATTFALGGELYEIPGYAPGFRLAVVFEGNTYLAEAVSKADNSPLEADYFFKISNLEGLIRAVNILPHMGGMPVYQIEKRRDAQKLVRSLTEAAPVMLSEEEYSDIAQAQLDGRSWQADFLLADGTSISMYILPDLGYCTLGDHYYALPDKFFTDFGTVFGGFEQGPLAFR